VNVEPTYGGFFGPARPNAEFYPPQDLLFVRYQLRGVRYREVPAFTSGGAVDLEFRAQLIDGHGETLLTNVGPIQGGTSFGGPCFPGYAFLPLTTALPPGQYTLRLTVTDKVSSATARFERPVTLAPARLAVNAALYALDADGKVAVRPDALTTGYALYHRLNVVGLDGSKEFLEVTDLLELIDADTGKVLQRSETPVRQPNPRTPILTGHFTWALGVLTRPGRFIHRHTITDKVSGKSVVLELPLCVREPSSRTAGATTSR